jgi:hypothetical protein
MGLILLVERSGAVLIARLGVDATESNGGNTTGRLTVAALAFRTAP